MLNIFLEKLQAAALRFILTGEISLVNRGTKVLRLPCTGILGIKLNTVKKFLV